MIVAVTFVGTKALGLGIPPDERAFSFPFHKVGPGSFREWQTAGFIVANVGVVIDVDEGIAILLVDVRQ